MVENKDRLDLIYAEMQKMNTKIVDIEKTASVNQKMIKEKFLYPDDQENSAASHLMRQRFIKSLSVVSIITIILMTMYEVLKQLLHPEISIWESHMITIAFSGMIAPIGAYFAFRKIEALRLKTMEELDNRVKAEKALLRAHDELEEKVNLRTKELSGANASLIKEIEMRRQAEEELRKYAEELLQSKEIMEDSAFKLASLNEKLSKSEKELQNLNASKDKFFSILAHDLKSPFNSLIGSSELLSKEIKELSKKDAKEFADSIYDSAKRIHRLLENLLQWSTFQTGRLDFKPVTFDVCELIHDSISLFKDTAATKGIKIISKVEPDSRVFADIQMINSVTRNLLSNAIKFSHQKSRVKIKAKDQGCSILLSIEDNGVGIDEERIKRIFSAAGNTSTLGTNNEQGTGLGLILCRDFVEKNGGQIIVNSVVGEGTAISFTLPKPSEK